MRSTKALIALVLMILSTLTVRADTLIEETYLKKDGLAPFTGVLLTEDRFRDFEKSYRELPLFKSALDECFEEYNKPQLPDIHLDLEHAALGFIGGAIVTAITFSIIHNK